MYLRLCQTIDLPLVIRLLRGYRQVTQKVTSISMKSVSQFQLLRGFKTRVTSLYLVVPSRVIQNEGFESRVVVCNSSFLSEINLQTLSVEQLSALPYVQPYDFLGLTGSFSSDTPPTNHFYSEKMVRSLSLSKVRQVSLEDL